MDKFRPHGLSTGVPYLGGGLSPDLNPMVDPKDSLVQILQLLVMNPRQEQLRGDRSDKS